eukprot:14320643-Ditylum_brightwellii.AAC.1
MVKQNSWQQWYGMSAKDKMTSNTLLRRYLDPLLSFFVLVKYYSAVFDDGRMKQLKENPPPS